MSKKDSGEIKTFRLGQEEIKVIESVSSSGSLSSNLRSIINFYCNYKHLANNYTDESKLIEEIESDIKDLEKLDIKGKDKIINELKETLNESVYKKKESSIREKIKILKAGNM